MKIGLAIWVTILLSIVSVRDSSGQYLYVSTAPYICSIDGVGAWGYIDSFHLYLHLPQVDDAIGASFRLESSTYGPEDFAGVRATGDVSIESGDILSGMVLSFPAGRYEFDALLTIRVVLNEPHPWGQTSQREPGPRCTGWCHLSPRFC